LPAQAHVQGGLHRFAWSFEPWVLALLCTALLAYVVGVRRARRRRDGHGPFTRLRIASFVAGSVAAFLALTSPIDTIGEQLFSVHMMQHLMLMLVAAPLLVWGRPMFAFLWSAPRPVRKAIGRWWSGPVGRGVMALRSPIVVWVAFCGVFVFWHLPKPYAWALGSELVHTIEHLAFFVSAFAFWSLVSEDSRHRRLDYGATLLFVATAAAFSGLPGALMVIAPRPLYAVHAAGEAAWGMTPIEDQQLAGLVMWIPGGFVYLTAISYLFLMWLRSAERRTRRPTTWAARLAPLAVLIVALLSGCDDQDDHSSPHHTFGRPSAGARHIAHIGCGSCHTIPGIKGAHGLVGPPLDHMGRRVYIAGLLRNTPANMVAWLRHPQLVVPGNVMPDMGLTDAQARDIAAYLYTLD